MKHFRLLLILFILINPAVFSQTENQFSVNLIPYGSVPLGSSGDVFNIGFGGEASISFIPAAFRVLGLGIWGDFIYLPIRTSDSIWVVSGSAGPLFKARIGDRFSLYANGFVGYYYFDTFGWDSAGDNGGGLTYGGGAGFSLRLAGAFALGLGASYDYYSQLYNGISINLSLRLDFPSPDKKPEIPEISPEEIKVQPLEITGKGVELLDLNFTPLFPVLYKYYDTNPVGVVRVKNSEEVRAEEISIQFYVERYMDNPMKVREPFALEPGEEKQVELFGLFTEDMMGITEGTKASAKIELSYTIDGNKGTADYTPVLEFYNRNALTWDDDRKIASFVTAKDPDILGFAKNVTTWMQGVKNPAIDEHLQKAMALFEAVKSFGIQYEIDPVTPFAELSRQKTVIDFLQFPRQTLQYSNGDCDDLTALYTSLLEAVGVETAVITTPGHIFAAFALKSSPEEARRTFSKVDELLFLEEKAWIPVEITLFQDSFEKAWQTGAKQWRENNAREQSRFFPTRDSWSMYQAVGFHEVTTGIRLPDRDSVIAEFEKSINRHVEREIYPQVLKIQSKAGQDNNSLRSKNQLAVLYARYGLYDRALNNLKEITDEQEYKPALINTGNLYYIKDDFETALTYYQRVIAIDGNNKNALLGAARCNHELENYGFVSKTYSQLKSLDPELAMRFAYLDLRGDEAGRAADAVGLRDSVLWEEEE